MENDTKTFCPKCAEEVKPEATICKHCGSKIKPVAEAKLKKKKGSRMFILLLLFGVAMAFMTASLSDSRDTSSNTSNQDICQMGYLKSKHYVEDVLKSPSTAKFPKSQYAAIDIGNSTCEITSYVDSQNSFGAEIRSSWTATVRLTGGSQSDSANWVLEELVFDGEQVHP